MTSISVRDRSRETAARWVLATLVTVACVLLALVVAPFWKSIFLGAVLAGAVYPWYGRLAKALRGRSTAAALLVTIGVTLLIVVPTLVFMINVGREAVQAFDYVRDTLRSEGVAGLVNDLPAKVRPLGQKLLSMIPSREQQQLSHIQSSQAAAAVGGVLQATSSAVVQVSMMLIAFFFLLTDGPRLVSWICENAPLPSDHTRSLLTEFRQVSVSVLLSSSATAAVQALIALVGYLMVGVPQPFFFAAATFLMAFVPAVGGGGTVVAVAAFVFLTGNIKGAIFLALWGAIVVGLSDNALKPLLMRSDVGLHPALIFFALLGGLASFGSIGLVAGPLVLVFFLAVVRMAHREYQPAAPEPIAARSGSAPPRRPSDHRGGRQDSAR